MGQKSSYQDFVHALDQIRSKHGPKAGVWPLIITVGDEPHLHFRAAIQFRKIFGGKGGFPGVSLDIEEASLDELCQVLGRGGLFEPTRSLIVFRGAKKLKLWESFASIAGNEGALAHPVLVMCGSDKLPVKATHYLKGVRTLSIPCDTPPPYELPVIAKDFAREAGVLLDGPALAALVDAVGFDLSALDNEIRNLAISFHGRDLAIRREEVLERVTLLRQDNAFKIDDFLRHAQHGQVSSLLFQLMNRGESPLAVLGLLTRHIRNALRAKEAARRGVSPQQLATELRMPPAIARNLMAYSNQVSEERFVHALAEAARADQLLKSEPRDSALLLQRVAVCLSAN